jgi:hypothetical protein
VRVQPFVGVHSLQTVTDEEGARLTIVSTGVLPVRITSVAHHGNATPAHFTYGTVKDVEVTGDAIGGRYLLAARLHLTPLEWLLLWLFWLTPFFVSVRLARRPTEHDFEPAMVAV